MLRTTLIRLGSVVFIGAIALAARLTGFDLLMFPELGALSNDIIKRPYGKWASAPVMLVLTPLVTAIVGVWITNHMAFGVAAIVLDVAIALGVIEAIRSPIAPAISAGLLPLVLDVHSWWYPPAITAGTASLALISIVRRRFHPKTPVPSIRDKVDNVMEKAASNPLWLLPFLFVLVGLAFLAQHNGWRLLLFPPIVVIGFEMFAHPLVCPWAVRPWHLPLACTLGALAGVGAVSLLGPGLGAVVSMMMGILILRVIDLHAPPVLAIGLLPTIMTRPTYSFVVLVLASTMILTISFRLWQVVCLHWMRRPT
ncbi:HPP family protein [Dyella dinghuensis]|uniref:HPP family protein n=1 Tax=Dyella dinghuensis TaxID=1920169 RepID=A0A432LWL1_9GAMM|nr:HPP family protein [Dyella dinghuensis]RUL65823.1 HPP family protein [Dyella dinghuensis]